MSVPSGDQAGSSLKTELMPFSVMRVPGSGGGGSAGSAGGGGTVETYRSTIVPSSIEYTIFEPSGDHEGPSLTEAVLLAFQAGVAGSSGFNTQSSWFLMNAMRVPPGSQLGLESLSAPIVRGCGEPVPSALITNRSPPLS